MVGLRKFQVTKGDDVVEMRTSTVDMILVDWGSTPDVSYTLDSTSSDSESTISSTSSSSSSTFSATTTTSVAVRRERRRLLPRLLRLLAFLDEMFGWSSSSVFSSLLLSLASFRLIRM
ncbi:hypothetical protein GCK72_018273 [Caenorhabditis remanei]|uniref:Uncharacterized protein n=1 Tax=Caenorhabditis remanei TaxID=31234 RepID=A0A6A5GBD3_CAERE|nr:hypothetical protein GCK72_018273 [Caenorhabditis remanei]KAF1751719.1 hypothetical protein GCK72_018273 [Caenorhabditis remanei]